MLDEVNRFTESEEPSSRDVNKNHESADYDKTFEDESSYKNFDKSSEQDNININISENSESFESELDLKRGNNSEKSENLRNIHRSNIINQSLTRFTTPIELQNSVNAEIGNIHKRSPLEVLAMVAEIESERLEHIRNNINYNRRNDFNDTQESTTYKRRPGRPRNITVNDPSFYHNIYRIPNIPENFREKSLFKKIKIENLYNVKDGEPQKIIIHKKKESESRDGADSSKSDLEISLDEFTIKKYGDIPESTFTTGWQDNVFVYFCPEEGCGKFFPSISRAKRHYIIHTEAKPYKCPNPGCNKRFSRKDNMNQHCRLHCKYANP